MSSRASHLRFLLIVALGILLVISMPSVSRETHDDMKNDPPSLGDSSNVISATGDVYDGSGDWIITQPTVYTDNLSIVVNGDILIQNGGSLTLENSAINFNTTSPLLNVSDGGYLEGQDSNILEEGGGSVIHENYSIEIYGNISWTGGYFHHFDEITIDNSTLNATFANCDFAYGSGRIDIRRAHSVNFTGCNFYEINCGHAHLIDTTNGNLMFNGGVLIEDCTFGSESQSSPVVSEGIIDAYNFDSSGDFKILSNFFYEIVPSSSGYIIDMHYVGENSTIADNRFIRCENQIIRMSDDGAIVSGNKFFSNDIGTFADVHIINMNSNDTKIEKNFFWNNTVDSDIHVTYGNNTIRWNTVLESPRKAIELDKDADGCIVYGNALYSNNVGLYIWEQAENQQIYLNAFLDNDQHAVDKNGTNAITWNNGTHGNFWDNYTGAPSSENPWIGDSPFSPHENITDDYPSFMIGALPPSSDKWETDIPNIFAVNNLTIDGDVEVSGPTGSILLLSNSLRNTGGREFTFGENTVFMLQDAEVTTTSPTAELGDFHLTDVFYFGVIESSISNIHSEFGQNDFTVSARMVDIENSTFGNIPGMRIDLHSDYTSLVVDWEPFGMCTIENNVFEEVKGDSSKPNAMHVEWPNINFKNNSVKAASPSREVQLFSQYQTSYPYDLFVTAEGCTIANASLNVTAIGDATANITNCEIDEGIIAYSRFSNIYDTNVYIVGNTITSGGIQAGGRMWGATECYAHLDLNDNNVTGTTDLVRLSSCTANNNTFNDDLWLEDSSDCTFSSSDIKASIDFDGPLSSITFTDVVFNSSGTIDIGSTGGTCHYLTFDNCTFDMIAWQLWSNCRFVNFLDSTFYSGLDIALTPVHNVTVQSSEFYLSGDTAIHIDGNNATIVDNTIVNSSHAIIIEGGSSQGKNPIVNGNRIANISGNGIDIAPDASEVQIEGNRISNCSGFGIRARYVSNHSVVSNNYVELAGSYGIYIEAYPTGAHGYFSNVTHNVVRLCSGDGLEIEKLYNSMIFNNTLTMNGGFGVVPISCGDAAFWMNILYENDAGNIDGAGGMHFDNGTLGNFWGPSGPDGNDYYHGYDDGGNPWIGDIPYEVASGNYDNYPLLHNQPMFLNEPNTINDIFAINFRLIVLNTTLFPQKHMYLWENGNLTLIGTTVEFQSDSSTIQYVVVEDGCEFRLIGGATITANNTQATYGFGLRSGARLVIDNASIYRCGYGAGNPGFLVNITTVSFNNLRVGDSSIGMELYQISLNVSNLRFTDCGVGLLVRECSSCNISGLTFSNVDSGLQLNSSSDCTVSMNDFTGCNDYGLSIDDASSSNIIEDNIFGQIPGTALYISSSGNEIYLNAFAQNGYHIDEEGSLSNTYNNGTFGNFYLDYEGVDDDGNLVGDTSYSSAISDVVDTLPVMVFGNFPTPTGWTISRTTAALNTNYTMTGNVDIYSNLMLFDTRLWINCTSTNQYKINVYDGGSLGVSGAILRALNSTYRFGISAAEGSSLSIDNARLIDLHEFQCYTSDIQLTNATFTDVYDGLRLLGTGVTNLVLQNCTVDTAERYAIYVNQASNVTILDWVFYSVNTGVYYDDSIGTLRVVNSTFHMAGYVINGHTADILLIEGIEAYQAVTRGIRCYYVDNATILDTHIEMNGGGRAFDMDDFASYYLLQNSYAFNGTTGVRVYSLSNGTIDDCEFWNFTTGIYMDHFGDPLRLNVTNSLFYGCTTGYRGHQDGYVLVYGNTFRYCGMAINALDSEWSSFRNNQIFDSDYGFYTTYNALHHCEMVGNSYTDTDYPIYIEGTQNNFNIENETILNCIDGITLSGSWIENVTIHNITITGASGDAIYLKYSRNVLLSNLTLENFTYGIFFDLEAGPILMNASSLTNGDWAIHLEEPSLTMRDCTISDMVSGAFEYEDLWFPDLYLDIDTSNIYDGLPIYSYFNVSNAVISGHETYSLSVVQSSNVTVAQFQVHRGDDFLIFDSFNITVTNSTIYSDISMEGTNYTFIGNQLDNVTIDFISSMDNLTFMLNAFLTEYDFTNGWQVTGFYLNGSQYGNYWHDYSGTDSNDDGIGDEPFNVPITYVGSDYLPLMTNPLEFTVVITIYSPSDGSTLQGIANVLVNVDVTTGFYYEEGVSTSTIITINGTEIATGGEGDIEIDWNTTEHADGWYTFQVTTTVNDVEDFVEDIAITLDNTAPVLDPSIEDGEATSDSTPQWRVDASDELSNLIWIAVYLDGSEVKNETASGQGDYLYFPLDLTEERSYELCLCSMDEVGNLAQVNLTIYYDTTPPEISSPSDISYESGTTGNTITWVVSDLTPSHYNVTINGESSTHGDWDGSDIEINVDGLDIGFNTVSIQVHDRAGNYATDLVEVTVTVADAPSIDHPTDIEYDEGSTGHNITWNPDDPSPDSYVVFRNGSEEESGNWDGSSITVSVDDLGLGVYNFTIVVNNTGGYSVADIVFVTVVDGTPPIINHPPDFSYDEGATGYSIIWYPDDEHPASYEIFRNGTLVKSGLWNSSEESIEFNVDGLTAGAYNFTIVVADVGGNTVSDEIIVTVNPDTTIPEINHPDDISYEEGDTGNTIIWSPSDDHPSGYEIFRNGTLVTSGAWNSSSEDITISVDGLNVGIWNYTIVVTDAGGNTVSDTVLVTVFPSDTTTTTTGTTETTTTGPTPAPFPVEMIVAIVGAVAVIAVIIVVAIKKRK
ncbi:MAG: right-handed parallel beta-helix repeat-containing protein [Candidatus Thorarchaeota archaeon]